ncbi:MAG: FAD-dependent oxidoreductase [Sphaerochaetaceae bacterium]|nr:FAD-dependent oxidoreductase [Sphaerochaetaceae bacterium]
MEKFYTEPARELPVIETDVFVAGAGTAGFIAATAAARAGARVLLVEKLPVPGGTLTNGGIGFNAYYSQEIPGKLESRRISGGLAYELAQRLENAGNSTGFSFIKGDHYRTSYRFMADHEALKAVASEMLMEAGVSVLLQTYLSDVVFEDGMIKAVMIENKDGRSAVIAKQYIDATGDGDIARRAGLEQKELWQDYDKVCGGPTGLVFGMAGIDFGKAVQENDGAFRPISAPIEPSEGKLGIQRYSFAHVMKPDRYPLMCALPINFFTSFQSIHEGEATYINNSKAPKIDGTKAFDLSLAEMKMRSGIMKMANTLKKEVPGFENSYVNWASVQLGVRASRITMCDYMISQDDITSAKRFPDEIGLYAFHDLAPKHEELFCAEPGFYGLPYRMILPVGADNLYVTGRAVTLDLTAHMSTRNTVCCMEMGEAAGIAAALCAKENKKTRELEYEKLREALLEAGVILE